MTASAAQPGDLVVGEGDSDLDGTLSKELTAFNITASGVTDQREFTVKVVDDEDLVAGRSGWTWGTCAGIALVWVREDARRTGVGSRLLVAAEQVARQRGCERLTVSSFTFQAPAFYERHGFRGLRKDRGTPGAGPGGRPPRQDARHVGVPTRCRTHRRLAQVGEGRPSR